MKARLLQGWLLYAENIIYSKEYCKEFKLVHNVKYVKNVNDQI